MLVAERVKLRYPELKEEENEALLQELVLTSQDRIKLRVGEADFPHELDSIAVEVVSASYNRMRHEGLESEDIDNTFRVRLIEDVLKQYGPELAQYVDRKKKEQYPDIGVLKFL